MPLARLRTRAMVAALVTAIALGGGVAPIAAQTVPPPTVVPPTAVPPTQPPPPPPTSIPPTAVPPTDVPPTAVPPTDVPPTDVPPTDVPPTATTEPTNTPNAIPTEPGKPPARPTSPPVQQPQQPQAPRATEPPRETTADIECRLAPEARQLAPGSDDWSLYACSFPLDFSQVDRLTITATSGTPGWQLIVVEESDSTTPGLLDASNNRLDLRPENGTREMEFLLGAKIACTTIPATTISFEIVTTAPESGSRTTATADVSLEAVSTLPTLTLQGLTGQGELTIAYTNAPESCGWQLLVTADGSTDTPTVGALTAPEGSRAATLPGQLSVLVPAGAPAGTITIGTDLTPNTIDALIVEAYPAP